MLNILIARFSFQYEQVQQHARRIAAFLRYELAMEYYKFSTLPPPLVWLDHIGAFFTFIIKKFKHCANRKEFNEAKWKVERTYERVYFR